MGTRQSRRVLVSVLVGLLSASLAGSYIYALQFNGFVYIGETQRNPVARWSQHLIGSGSFVEALAKRDVVLSSEDGVYFLAFRCDVEKAGVLPVARRIFTQAVEHELHCLFASRRTCAKVISDTVRTCPPVAFFTVAVREIAETMFGQLERLLDTGSPND